MLTLEDFKRAIDQNIVVHDDEMEGLTYRVVGLMIDIALLNYKQRLDKIYVPPLLCEWSDGIICGLSICKTYQLDPNGNLYKYYFDSGCVLRSRRTKIICGTGPNDTIILGAI